MKNLSLFISLLVLLTACGDDAIKPYTVEAPGPQGKDGSSCSVEQVSQGALITCTDGTGALVSNGKDGADATLPDTSFVSMIDPGGPDPDHFDEILLVTQGGDYIAYFEDGGKRFLTVLECGKNYRTTDRQNVKFRITEECEYEES